MKRLIESSYITTTQVPHTEANMVTLKDETDILARVQTSSALTKISLIETKDFFVQLSSICAAYDSDISTLNEVVNWQQRVIDFNSSYAAYLLEQLDDDEFERIANEMAVEERELPKEVITSKISQILRLTTIDFTPSDLANLLHCSPDSVFEAIHCIQTPERSHIKLEGH